jgi:hypothetical protein
MKIFTQFFYNKDVSNLPPEVKSEFLQIGRQQKQETLAPLNEIKETCGEGSLIASLARSVSDLIYMMVFEENKDKLKAKIELGKQYASRLKRDSPAISGVEDIRNPQKREKKAALTDFARKQAQVVVYNKAQWLARKAAVSVGEEDWYNAERALAELSKQVDMSHQYDVTRGLGGNQLQTYTPSLKLIE